jgi:hypothetical protein
MRTNKDIFDQLLSMCHLTGMIDNTESYPIIKLQKPIVKNIKIEADRFNNEDIISINIDKVWFDEESNLFNYEGDSTKNKYLRMGFTQNSLQYPEGDSNSIITKILQDAAEIKVKLIFGGKAYGNNRKNF